MSKKIFVVAAMMISMTAFASPALVANQSANNPPQHSSRKALKALCEKQIKMQNLSWQEGRAALMSCEKS